SSRASGCDDIQCAESAQSVPEAGSMTEGARLPESVLVLIVAVVAAAVGAVLGYAARRLLAASRVKHAESYADRIIAEARAKQKEIVLEGKDAVLQQQRASEEEAREKRTDLQRQERLLLDRSESLDRKLEALERREAAT